MAKKMKEKEIQSIPEMEASVIDLEKQIFALRNELSVQRKLEKPHLLKAQRHQKARLLTALTLERRKAQ